MSSGNSRPRRPRRVQLAVPGSSDKMMAKAAQSRADHVFLQSPGGGGFVVEKEDRIVGTVAFLRYDSFAWIANAFLRSSQLGMARLRAAENAGPWWPSRR